MLTWPAVANTKVIGTTSAERSARVSPTSVSTGPLSRQATRLPASRGIRVGGCAVGVGEAVDGAEADTVPVAPGEPEPVAEAVAETVAEPLADAVTDASGGDEDPAADGVALPLAAGPVPSVTRCATSVCTSTSASSCAAVFTSVTCSRASDPAAYCPPSGKAIVMSRRATSPTCPLAPSMLGLTNAVCA